MKKLKNLLESINVYHGSAKKFSKFDMNKVGSGDGRNLGGWGIYFTDSEEVAHQYTTNKGFVGSYKILNGNYFDLDEGLDTGIANSIMKKLEQNGIDSSEIEEFKSDYIGYIYDVNNKQVYDWLSIVLGSQKNASLFLEDLGFIGNKFSDKTIPEATNYVIFSVKSIF